MRKIVVVSKKGHIDKGRICEEPTVVDLPYQIAETLITNQKITFRAISWCMFPVIRPGDILKIASVSPENLNIGDIVLYKSMHRVYAHRLAGIYQKEGAPYIITTGEREYRDKKIFCNCGSDEGIAADNILGRVTEIRRGRLSFKPNDADESLASLMQGRLQLSLWTLKRKAKQYIAIIFIKLQSVRLYRYCLKVLMRNKTSFLVGTPLIKNTQEFNNLRFYQAFEDFLKNLSGVKELYNIIARINNRPVGNISLFLEVKDNYKTCTLSNFIVRIPFRGLGIGSQLLGKALHLCDKINMDETKIELPEENRIAVHLFKKMGFEIR